MKFIEVLPNILEGKKVRRGFWGEHNYLLLTDCEEEESLPPSKSIDFCTDLYGANGNINTTTHDEWLDASTDIPMNDWIIIE